MSARRAAIAASFLIACTRSPSVANDAAPPTTIDAAPPVALVPPSALDASTPHVRPPLAPCRAIAVTGIASNGDAGLATGVAIDDGWTDLAAAARMTIKEPRTGRELLFLGPAHARPCVEESEAWLTRGEFQSARGSGEKPGAEEWIVTPYAVVRYGAAIVDVKVDGESTRATLRGGGASMLAAGGDSWHALDPSVPLVAKGGPDDDANLDAGAPDRCTKTSADAKALEDQLLAPGETRDPGFGDLAKRTTEARILARGVCAMKALRAVAPVTRASNGGPSPPSP